MGGKKAICTKSLITLGEKSFFAHRRADHVLALIYADPYIHCTVGICLIPWLVQRDMQFSKHVSDLRYREAIQHGEQWQAKNKLYQLMAMQLCYLQIIFKIVQVNTTTACSLSSCKTRRNFYNGSYTIQVSFLSNIVFPSFFFLPSFLFV